MGIIEKILALFGLKSSPESLTRRAAAFAAKDNVSNAVENYKKALAMDPLYVPAYDGLGKVYFRMGFRDEADREFAIADGLEKLSEDPFDMEAGVKMGWAMMAKGLHKYVVSLLDPLLKKNPRSPELLKIMGGSYKSIGNEKAARQLFRVGVERWPRDPEFYLNLGSLELKSGDREEGEKLTNIARLMGRIQSDPLDMNSRIALSRIFMERNLFGEAAEYLRQAVNLDTENEESWYGLGECYQKAGQVPAAIDALKQAARRAPEDPRPHKMMSRLYQIQGKSEESKQAKELTAILEGGQGESTNPQTAARFVKYLMSISLSERAADKLKEFLEKWPEAIELKVIMGRLQFKNGDYMAALGTLKEAAQTKDDWAEPHIWMAMTYQKLGDHMSALAEGQLATRLAPKSHTAHRVLGDILREQKKFGMAENAYETAENLKAKK